MTERNKTYYRVFRHSPFIIQFVYIAVVFIFLYQNNTVYLNLHCYNHIKMWNRYNVQQIFLKQKKNHNKICNMYV